MITHDAKTGYPNNYMLIRYLSIWNAEIGGHGQMKFYKDSIDHVVDIGSSKDGADLIIYSYPHNNNKDVMEIATKLEPELWEIYGKAVAVETHRKVFTIDLDKVKILVEEDFKGYTPSIDSKTQESRTELFYFQVPAVEGGFPQLYIFEKVQRKGTYGDVFPIFAQSSSDIMRATNPTNEGKRFTYNLLNSYRHKSYVDEYPSIAHATFPDNGLTEISPMLNTKALMEFVEKCRPETLTVKGGKMVYDPDIKGELADPIETTEEDVDKIMTEMFGKPEPKVLKEKMEVEWLDKQEVHLSDVYQFGLDKTLSILPFTNMIINVVVDVPGVARKMCIYEGGFHIIPMQQSNKSIMETLEWFGETPDIFHFCTEENYPKKLLPSPKAD